MTGRRGVAFGAATGVTVVALALLLPSTSGVGFPMDEGAVVAYASEVLDGAVPHRDFLTFYGPGNPWLVAGAFVVAGESVATERVVGLFYRLVIVLSLFALAMRLGGLLAGVLSGVVAAWLMSEEIVWAYATYGAIAFGLLSLVLASGGSRRAEAERAHLPLFAAGLAGGAAVLVRFDFAPAVIASAVPLLALVSWRARAWWGAGLLVTAGIYVVHLAVVGGARIERLLGDLSAAARERKYPLPVLDTEPGLLFAAGVVAAVGFVALGAVLWRRGDRASGQLLVGVGLFSCALVPLTVFRADPLHVRPFVLVPLSLLPAVALLSGSRLSWVGKRGRAAMTLAVAAAAVLPLFYDADTKLQRARDLRGIRTAERGFYDDSAGARHVVERLRTLARPGDRLFVGMKDLRRAEYGPSFMYFLLRDLEPASYYMELNPGTANREGSGLAADLRHADWLILTTEYDSQRDSTDLGPNEPNEVVRDSFCPRFESGGYYLYGRCRPLVDTP